MKHSVFDLINKFAQYSIKEQEELLSKWFEQEPIKVTTGDGYIIISQDDLRNIGLYLIQRPSESLTSYLGGGLYSSAYEALYNGNRVAVKLTSSQQDASAMEKLYNLSKNNPSIAKNIAKVFAIKKIPVTTQTGIKAIAYAIIVEYLQPISQNIFEDLFAGEDPLAEICSMRTELLVNNEEKLKSLLSNNLPKLSKKDIDDLYLDIKNLFFRDKDKEKHLINLLLNILSYKLKDYHSKYEFNYFISKVEMEIRKNLPRSIKDKDAYYLLNMHLNHPDKHVRDLVKTLITLNEKFGIEYQDLHDANLMIRPSTGDFVLSDPGLFIFE